AQQHHRQPRHGQGVPEGRPRHDRLRSVARQPRLRRRLGRARPAVRGPHRLGPAAFQPCPVPASAARGARAGLQVLTTMSLFPIRTGERTSVEGGSWMEDGVARPSALPHPRSTPHYPPVSLLAAVLVAALLATTLPARAQILPAFGNDRKGTAGFQFLKIPVDARSAAMGETVVANAFDASALFWNPALAAQADGAQVGIGHTAYYAGINLESVAAIYHVGAFTLGASVQALNSGEMEVTTEFEPTGTGETFRLVDVAAGLTVAQQLTDLFSYGVTLRYVQESVVNLTT